MIEFKQVVKEAHDFCYNKSYPNLPLDTDILEEIPNYKGWEDIDLSTVKKYRSWLSEVRCELNRQNLEYQRDEL